MDNGSGSLSGRRVRYDAPYGIPGLFRDQRLREPGAVAASDERRRLTYYELDLLSDELAASIRRVTGGRRGAVALLMPRQVDMLVSLLGVLKAGCHYVPVAPDEPPGRVRLMMEVVHPLCWVVAGGCHPDGDGVPVVRVPDAAGGPFRPLRPVAPEDPVYALFTSGSSGTPKAVLVGSAALTNRILWMAGAFAFTGADRVLQKTPYTFDVAGWEFYVPIVSGGCCVFAPDGAHHDPLRIERVVNDERITACHFVPSMLEAYLRIARVAEQTSLRLVLCSGEALPAPVAARFVRESRARLHNLYGPTEAAIDVTHWPVDPGIGPLDPVPIGAPIDNVDLCVVGDDGRRLPEGEAGELWIGGVQVALGYVGAPELTERAFVTSGGQRWYRTGDLTRIDGGQVYYLGRNDAQIKIRGIRVEPGEVEAVLRRHDSVGQVVVVAVPPPDGGSPEMVAVAVPSQAPAPSEAFVSSGAPASSEAQQDVLAFAGSRLPGPFVPRMLFWTDALPVTAAGKADRRRVAAIASELWAAAAAPAGPAGDAVAELWWRMLGTPADRRDENAGFLNVGGHSLVAAHLLATLAENGHGEAPPSVLLRDNLSLSGLRERLARTPPGPGPDRARVTDRRRSPLTPAQEPLWVISQALADPGGYNVVGSLHIPAVLDDQVLLAALRDVTSRHDMLRAAITTADGVPGWSYARRAEVRLQSTVTAAPLTDDLITRFAGGVARETIDVQAPALMRAGVLHGRAHGDCVLVLVLHHIIADQRTLEIVMTDVAAAYDARAAGKAPSWPTEAPSFADFAHGRAAAAGTPAHEADLAYWERTLRDAPVRTPMPFQLDGPGEPTLAGRRTAAGVGSEPTRRIDRLLAERGHTTATYFLACVTSVLAAWAGEPSVTVGMPVSRRLRPGDFGLVGHVLATVPLRVGAGSPVAVLDHVRDRQVEAAEHATPSFPQIVRRLGLPLSLRDNPLFQVWVNDMTRVGPAPALAGAVARWIDAAPPAALFDLNFYVHRDAVDGYRLECVAGVGRYPDAVVDELLRQIVAVARLAGELAAPPEIVPRHTEAAPAVDPVAAIRDIAHAHPARVALVDGADRWTYAELLARAGEVAEAVTAAGVAPGDVLHVVATRTASLPAALLGAWTAGATIAVTDGGEPPAVRSEQTELLRPKVVLYPSPMNITAGHRAPRRLDGISHVLFTSGTSGRPAAVRVPAAALASTLRWYTEHFEIAPEDRVAMLGGLGHDPLLRDILPTLAAGGTLVIPPEDVFASPGALFALLRDHRITVLNATPALLELILAGRPRPAGAGQDRLDDLRLVVSGGAPLTAGLVRALREVTPARVVNAYGTTETPQIASCQEVAGYGGAVPDTAVLPVGAGVAGAELLVLLPDGSPAPIGRAGEIVVRSPNLAAGYLGGERSGGFGRTPGAYHTGDRGRWDPSGSVVPDGRLDRQVSIDGHRLEPERVERVALRHPAVRQALVRLRPAPAGPVLTLWVVPQAGRAAPDVAGLRAHLRSHLPRYAVPAEILLAADLITDGHHKVVAARPAAPAPHARAVPARPAAAVPPGEKELTELVRELVGSDLAPTENFFDAGLSSVTLIRLHAALNERLGTDLPVTSMFEHPNLAALARFVTSGATAGPALRPRPAGDLPPAGIAQRRSQLRRHIQADVSNTTPEADHEPVNQG